MKELKDRVAVVTGAASGIGRETSIILAGEGCDLAIADLNGKGLKETAKIIKQTGRKVSTHLLDVSNKMSMKGFPGEVIKKHGRVHLLVNNAGVSVIDLFEDGSLRDFEWLMGINFWGVVYGCKFFLPHLLKEEEAHIVNMSSVFGLAGIPSQATYCSSKFAVRGFTDSLRAELAETNVHITRVHPGGVDTDIAKNARFKKSFNDSTREESIENFADLARTSSAKAARILVNGIKKDKKRILIGPDARFIDIITRLFPVSYIRILAALFNKDKKK